jgi:hypothetical protein
VEGVVIMSVVDLDMPLPLALAWRRDNTSPLLANFIAEVQRLGRRASGQEKLEAGFAVTGMSAACPPGYAWMQAVGLVNEHTTDSYRRKIVRTLEKEIRR